MIYYKIICNNEFIGIGTESDLLKHQKKHNVLLACGASEAEYIECNGDLYRDSRWMRSADAYDSVCQEASVYGIDKDEYDMLSAAIASNEAISISEPEEESEPEEAPADEVEELTAEYVRSVKIKEMSLACNAAISEGFDYEDRHYSLTLQDQQNLNAAQIAILSGEQEIAYHADGDDYEMVPAEEMLNIITAANRHRLLHLTYFNCLKKWINNLVQIKKIQSIEYGVEIPKKYQSGIYGTFAG